jgi:Ricin-type beta-trefoil lectin domain-like
MFAKGNGEHMRRRARSVSLCVGLLTACLSLAALTAAPAGASPVSTAHAAAAGLPASGLTSWIQLSNRYSGRCIDDPGQSSTAGQPLQQYHCNLSAAQQWEFWTDAKGYTVIYNNQNGLCITDNGGWIGDGVPVIQDYCDSAADEWQLTPVPGLNYTYYLSSPLNQWRVLSVPNWGVNDGDPLQVLGCACGANQQWIVSNILDLRGSVKKTPFRPPAS